jgi:hypothetical protein
MPLKDEAGLKVRKTQRVAKASFWFLFILKALLLFTTSEVKKWDTQIEGVALEDTALNLPQ